MSAGFESLSSAEIVGREAEQAHIGAFVDGVGDGVRALVIRSRSELTRLITDGSVALSGRPTENV